MVFKYYRLFQKYNNTEAAAVRGLHSCGAEF